MAKQEKEKREISKLDCMFIGLAIGIIAMATVFMFNNIAEANDCVNNNNHEYITRCKKCGDILHEYEINTERAENNENRTISIADQTERSQ